eukprot:TRINITY_DN91654_c0_g1_i1.p1 TRINITY_DN91654_c0_g1~~TRINITY_DN91654_c0_g1_i1.p1  ORF type:complete len:932 (+),score=255.17 TRINITY_DN91654_c0_g1_i1:34-2796(+)
MPLQKLSDVAGARPVSLEEASSASSSKVYRWIEFANKGEQVTEFDESHFSLEGHFESNSSEGHKTYQDRLRAVHFRKEGRTKAEIAGLLGRSEQFVAKWWQKDEREIPRPWGVHEYMGKELGSKTATSQAQLSDNSEKSTAAWWRDVEVRRKFTVDPDIYDEILNNTEWRQSSARTRDFSTGASHVKYDKDGKMKLQGNQGAKYVKGASPAFDKLLQKFFSEYGLADRTAGIALNWYPDGDGVLGSHRHDCWTALFSFGHERILTIDKTPLLLQDGDLVIFGTQRHGVPKMPEVRGGRITVPIFFYPDHLQMKKQWQTLTDPEDPRRSRELTKLQANHQLGADMEQIGIMAEPAHLEALSMLLQLGFEEPLALAALRESKFDAEQAAELLLLAGAAGNPQDALQVEGAMTSMEVSSAASRGSRWASRGKHQNAQGYTSQPCDICGMDDDAALALKMQLEEEEGSLLTSNGAFDAAACCVLDDEDANAALAAQLEEEDLARGGLGDAERTELIAQQFEEYEDQMKRDDAEVWHGKGDLMQSNFARENLKLETMDKVTCYSIGHGQISEKSFFELLQLNSIRVLYDFRASDHRGDVHAPCQHFSVRSLRSSCRVRGLTYKHIALGRDSAYGILRHVQSDEAKHALVELAWHAKRSRSCFLGFDQDWRLDNRQAIAEELARVGHSVMHIDCTGATEEHVAGRAMPDFLLQEEEKLRKLEKQRQAGELKRIEKSAVDRSSETVASKLMRPVQEVDAMDELRNAGNQVELVRAQRNLARVKRLGDKHGILANKVVTGVPQWIVDEAREQEAWIAKKKAEKANRHGTAAGSRNEVDAKAAKEELPQDATHLEEAELIVECGSCRTLLPWSCLAEGDGLCSSCAAVAHSSGSQSQPPEEETARRSSWRAARRSSQLAEKQQASGSSQ